MISLITFVGDDCVSNRVVIGKACVGAEKPLRRREVRCDVSRTVG